MNYQYIEQLLERYWQGETNLDEEQKKRLKKTVANNFKSLSQSAKTYLLNLAQSVSQRVH